MYLVILSEYYQIRLELTSKTYMKKITTPKSIHIKKKKIESKSNKTYL